MTDTKPLAEHTGLTVADVPHAPFVYFEEAPSLGYVNGLVRITLSAERATMLGGKIVAEQVVTGYLRTNLQGARALIDALNSALFMAAPVENSEGPKN